ncbi:MAG: hypothetical protein PHR77_14580 [Kiritimatiellae bacterium]|nr:hypothetical protein [Kiritimatiellia bacterium]
MYKIFILLVLFSLTAGAQPIKVGTVRQLFLDDHLIASQTNVSRKIHPARKHPANPVLEPTEPWERDTVTLYGSVIQDGDKKRMWYYAGGNVGYAESEDGLKWRKPGLGVITDKGRDTNLVISRGEGEGSPATLPYLLENFGVFRDDRDADLSRRYKMGYLSLHRNYTGPKPSPFHAGQRRGLGVAVSPDGIRWQLYESWVTQATCDGATHWMYDPVSRRYLLYGRTKFALSEVLAAVADKPWLHFRGRSVIRAESKPDDFLHWEQVEPNSGELVLTADLKDPLGSEIYSMMVFPYEGVYIGLVQMFHKQRDTCSLELQLAVSRDTRHFTRVGDRAPFIPVGPQGSWDQYNNSIATSPPLEIGDELWFYYGGRSSPHSPYKIAGTVKRGCIGLATIPRDRFVSLSAGKQSGQILTRPLQLDGRVLHLNANASAGRMTIEMVDAAGNVVARSKPITRDALDIPVEWETGGLETITAPVTLRIQMQQVELFALWCSRI